MIIFVAIVNTLFLHLKISERNVPTESSCTNCGYDGTISQKIGATTTVSQVGSILSKTSDGWNDVLKRIKKHLVKITLFILNEIIIINAII